MSLGPICDCLLRGEDRCEIHGQYPLVQQMTCSRDFDCTINCEKDVLEERITALEKELAAEKTKHVRFMVTGGPVVMASEYDALKAREAATIATVNAAWADTVAALTAERDALAATVKRLNGILAGSTRAETLNNLFAVAEGRINDRSLRILADEIFIASRTTPPKASGLGS